MAGEQGVPDDASHDPWLSRVVDPAHERQATRRHEGVGACPPTMWLEPWHIWAASHDRGVEGGKPRCWRAARGPIDAHYWNRACLHTQA